MNLEDRQFIKQFMVVLGALGAFTVVIFILARFLMATNEVDYGPLVKEQVDRRIQPVATVNTGKVPAPAAKTAAAGGVAQANGQQIYQQVCAACHDSGAAGAPKSGDKGAWAARIKKGKDTLYQSALNGIGAMPPKGGNAQLSEKQVKAAVDYMLHSVQ